MGSVIVAGSVSGSVGTLSRGLDILELFARRGPQLSQAQISEALGLPPATVHRLTSVLTERGFLEREPDTRRLRLGLELSRLIDPLLAGMRLPEVARGQLVALAARTGETVNLSVLAGSEIVYLLSETGARLLTPQATVGMRLPAHCTALGKCLLAQLPVEDARAALGEEPYESRTQRTLRTWSELAPALAEIRRTGVAHSEEEYEVGLVSIAVPVAWTAGPRSAAINVSLPSTRAGDAVRAELIELLQATARAIDEATGIPLQARERSGVGA
jgi:IclR family transcriptional regulator, acetate operon repressor